MDKRFSILINDSISYKSLFDFDRDAKWRNKIICGVDEAGRGCLFGPVTAACVILKDDFFNDDIKDSKKLNPEKREELYDIIIQNSLDYSVVSVNNYIIDNINILNSTKLAMKKCVENLKLKPDHVIVDGNFVPDIEISKEFIIKGDTKSACIAAAAILAKVTRDRILSNFDKVYNGFNFKKHKGYPTKSHYIEIEKHGVTKNHRITFLKKIKNIKNYEQ